MTSRPHSFIELSVALTGFSPVRLRGTGMTETYLEEIDSIVGSEFVDRLLQAFRGRAADLAGPDPEAVLDDEDLGPLARNITLMWYCGTWTQLPEEWRARNGAAATDITHVVSSAAYQSGLQWAVVGAHPAGARQQGFGAWSVAPVELAS